MDEKDLGQEILENSIMIKTKYGKRLIREVKNLAKEEAKKAKDKKEAFTIGFLSAYFLTDEERKLIKRAFK